MTESIENPNSRDTSPLDASARITSILSEPKNSEDNEEIKKQVIEQLLFEIQQDSETLLLLQNSWKISFCLNQSVRAVLQNY